MDELIRREDALKAIYSWDDNYWWYESRIEEVPAVDVKFVGCAKWEHLEGGRSICGNCYEYPLYDYHGRQKFSRFCPYCGYDMSVEK